MNMSLRQERMRLLALAPETSLDEALSGISLPGYRIVRGPETGLVMARGRVGNVGDVFNVGEVLVTRCVVQLEEKTLGVSARENLPTIGEKNSPEQIPCFVQCHYTKRRVAPPFSLPSPSLHPLYMVAPAAAVVC